MSAIRWLDVAELAATEPPPVPWVIERLVARGHLTMLFGAPGVSKSMLGLAMASAAANDAERFGGPDGLRVTGGPVIVLDAENGERVLHERAHLVELPSGRVRLGLSEGFDLRTKAGATEIAEAIRATSPALLLLDSFASLAPGLKESDSDAVGPVLDRVRKIAQTYGVGVLLLHHTRKAGDSYRGGTGIPAAVDIAALVKRDEKTTRTLDWSAESGGKMRLAEEPDPWTAEVVVTGGKLTVTAAREEAEPAKPDREDDLRASVLAAIGEHGPASRNAIARQVPLGRNDVLGTIRALLAEPDGPVMEEGGKVILRESRYGRYGTGTEPPESGAVRAVPALKGGGTAPVPLPAPDSAIDGNHAPNCSPFENPEADSNDRPAKRAWMEVVADRAHEACWLGACECEVPRWSTASDRCGACLGVLPGSRWAAERPEDWIGAVGTTEEEEAPR